MLCMRGLIMGACIARHVIPSTSTSPIAGTIVQAISVDRRGIATGLSTAPDIGDRIADRRRAICATRQQVAAIQNTTVARAGDMT